ncbi:acyl-CoA N-acyltransferase [Polychaeton citri CBS 116435]|uniref:Acyl-CoA N-acyltransferase n=1 Tax=Polychaeton citri CBS 116435 TaxID=1314669 RepID=A0A9P4QGH2_9PEZI|nr:acyl-CoA N-acyltransferase [Polychaeton citri CBS 116435]
MPRDLRPLMGDAPESTLDNMPELTKSPEAADHAELIEDIQGSGFPPGNLHRHLEASPESDEYESDDGPLGSVMAQRNEKRDELHPYTQTLTPTDVESCTKLEEEAFPPNERCTREKFHYRLTNCGELSLGIFTSSSPDTAQPSTLESSKPIYSGAPNRKAVLLGHIIATKTTNSTVTDDDMKLGGHKEQGRTVCIHSLATLPAYQKRGLGKTLMKAYLQRMEGQGVADRAALIAHGELVPFYESFGFKSMGESKVQFGGGGWWDMVYEFRPEE